MSSTHGGQYHLGENASKCMNMKQGEAEQCICEIKQHGGGGVRTKT